MKKFILALTDMAPNGTNDLIVMNNCYKIVDVIESCTFGYPSNTALKHDLSIDYDNTIGDTEALSDPEMQEAGIHGLYTVTIDQVLKRMAVSPVDDGSANFRRLKLLGLV